MSSTEFEINANKLQIGVLAYNLNNPIMAYVVFACRRKWKNIRPKPSACA